MPLTAKTNFKKGLLFLTVFYFFTFLTGGTITAVYTAFRLDYSSKTSVALMILPCIIILKTVKSVVRYVIFDAKENKKTVLCELTYNGKMVKCRGYVDSGNFIKDDSGRSVAVCSYKLFFKLIGSDLTKLKDRITVDGVSGKKQMFIVKADLIKIYYGEKPNIFYNVTVGMGKEFPFFDILLSDRFIEVENDVDVKKVAY